jgi:hypothetical protein
MFAVAALATWCWAADLNAPAACVYSEQSCREIVKLRGGVCYPAGVYRRTKYATTPARGE